MQTSPATIVLHAADGPFDLIAGIPVHPLVVHAAVVLLPLSAIGVVLLILIPRWRPALGWLVLAGLAVGTGAAFVAKESGEQLADRVGLPQDHAEWGDRLPWVAVALLLAYAAWFVLQRRTSRAGAGGASPATTVLGVVAILLALVSIGLTVLVGHSGAEAVWKGRVGASSSGTGATTGGTSGPSGDTGLTLAAVGQHSTAADCWTVVRGTVYDLTEWIGTHPGGAGVIEGMCGIDATAAFEAEHDGQREPEQELSGFEVGPLASTPAAAGAVGTGFSIVTVAQVSAAPARRTFTMRQVRRHSVATDCWSVVNRRVYDLTSWISRHPGGESRIIAMCGRDASAALADEHAGSAEVARTLAGFRIGRLA